MNSELQKRSATIGHRHKRTRSTSCSSVTSQSSTASWFPQKLYEASPSEVVEGDLQAHGSFTTTAPAALWLRSYLSTPVPSKSREKQRDMGWADEYDYEHLESPRSSSRAPHRPSISRSSSLNSSLGEGPTSASSLHDSPPMSPLGDNISTLHPILEAVESASKLSYRTVCVACLKTGKDFPRCPRCGDMWCSRECRMQGGKRHVCRR
ncbi:hypothetical protein K503DRAFT_135806 [Rhizopogon vinicolor AM-OR11-026]|uniref:HIT-type domain-containing protein n=1 Tax=Rhizopogon vinicolor AM-OR11-026 TaxID=1314800 RepID=A0A1B7N1N4_9AGAM|nr:hypothetical protein K503DRAFT_135806 [Rhizopogon vinicolor AM-OR11-026]